MTGTGVGTVGGPPPEPIQRVSSVTGFADAIGGDRRAWRSLAYLGLVVLLVVASILLSRFRYVAEPQLHTLLEAVSTTLAFVVGFLALVRFYSRRQNDFLFLGVGFLGAGILEAYHGLITSSALTDPADPALADLTAWTWIGSRVFLSLFFFVSWLIWFQEERGGALRLSRGRVEVQSVYVTAAVLTVVMFLFFAYVPLASAFHPDLWVSRPAEFIPATFFLLALVGYVQKGQWKRDTFEHWLVLALILSVATHAGFLAFSPELHDLREVVAHVLKIVSYVALLVGLLASVYLTFRREGEASAVILEANAALAHEIRTRREAEQILQESEERLRDFLDSASDLIQSVDPNGRITYVNRAWKRTLGYTDEDLEDLHVLSVVHEDSRTEYKRLLKRVFAGEIVTGFEVVMRARDGRSVYCSGSSNCRFEDGVPIATRSVLRDETEERRAATELTRYQANVRALLESTGDAIWSVDRGYCLITCNTAYELTVEAITGRVPVVGDPMERTHAPEALLWFEECYRRALHGTRFSAVRQERVGGHTRIYELFFNPIEGEAGPAGVVVFSKDITRRRRVEEAWRRAKEEAEEANRSKSQFLANMSHELRTPLNSVIGFANILLKNRSGALDTRELGFLDRILANGTHLLSLINEILDLAKVEAGRMELELESVDVPELVRETLAQLEGQVGSDSVHLRSEVALDPAPIVSDPGKLKQVLINLVGNALRFTERGEVVVRVEAATSGGPPVRILVRDTGIGIPEDRLKDIFEEFQQADADTASRFGGTGLGLTISRSLCRLMGYGITVDSQVGVGSTFTIRLPTEPPSLPPGGGSGPVEAERGPFGTSG